MIVLKTTQDKVLTILQSVAGMVERRHTAPALANVLFSKIATNQITAMPAANSAYITSSRRAVRDWALSGVPRCIGFFSASKANLRNAP